jgi:membrane-bound lytic murein transglycosylase B
MEFLKRSFLAPIFGLLIIAGSLASFSNVNAEDICPEQIEGKTREQLTKDLDACTKEIEKWTATLQNTQQQSASYGRDVAALTAKINAAQGTIKKQNIAISNLGKNINEKQAKIVELDTQIGRGRQALKALLKKTNEIDSFTIAEAVLSNKDLSDFFVDVDTYSSTQRSLEEVFNELRGIKTQTQTEKDNLNKQREAASNAKAQIEAAKKEVEKSQAEKKNLLAISKNQEKTYEQILVEKRAKAAQIRATLFPLRDTAAIPFGTALQYAQEASAKTGVRPAFLLAILTQESNLGANTGSCLVTDAATGAGKGANTGSPQIRVMSPTRDIPVFLDITKSLGKDYTTTRVSCWQPMYDSAGSPIGWGGAMGAAQFIPSTWKLFIPRIAAATGAATPNPWNAHDAFFASSLYLADLGASLGTYDAEKNAACKYYSGRACASGPGSSYGASVMAKAANIQTTMIDPLQGL